MEKGTELKLTNDQSNKIYDKLMQKIKRGCHSTQYQQSPLVKIWGIKSLRKRIVALC